ncbi:hypothetical protein HFK70_025380 [Escherichia coli]|nr:hypothetical protein [Escherichia coli]
MLPSETMIWQPEFTDKTLSRKPGAVQYQPIQFGAVEILLSDAQHHVVFRLFRMTGQEPAKVASGFRIHQRTDGFDKVHTEPDLSAAEGVVMFPRQTKQDPPYP